MKRSISFLIISVLLLSVCFLTASCAAPAKEPQKAAKALEQNGYTVALLEDRKQLDTLALSLNCGTLKAAITAEMGNERILIFYFNSEDSAVSYYRDVKDSKDFTVVDYRGTAVWKATSKDAVKAAK